MNNKTGLYFLSIEGVINLSCKIARFISDITYMEFQQVERSYTYYRSSNTNFEDELYFEFKVDKQIGTKTKIDNLSTEIYAIFQDYDMYINQYEIHHLSWLVEYVEINNLKCNYPRFSKFIDNESDKIQYSTGV